MQVTISVIESNVAQIAENKEGYDTGVSGGPYLVGESPAWQAGWDQGYQDRLEMMDNGFPI